MSWTWSVIGMVATISFAVAGLVVLYGGWCLERQIDELRKRVEEVEQVILRIAGLAKEPRKSA